MTAVAAVPVDRFEHEAMFYRGDADFLAGLLPFVREGLEQDEAVVIAEPRPRLDMLRDALGTDASAVELLDMAEIGANPARIIAVWAAVLEKHTGPDGSCAASGNPPSPAAGRPSWSSAGCTSCCSTPPSTTAPAGGCCAPTTRSTCRAR